MVFVSLSTFRVRLPPGGTINGVYKVIRQRTIESVEFATLEWVHWLDHRRLFEPIGDLPLVKFEPAY